MDQVDSQKTARARLGEFVLSPSFGFMAATGLIVLGFLRLPKDWEFLNYEPLDRAWVFGGMVQLSPLLPFALALLVTAGVRVPAGSAKVLAWLILPFGLLVTFFGAGFAGPGGDILLAQGLLLTMAVVGSLHWTVRDPYEWRQPVWAALAVLIAAIAAVWSLANVAVVLTSAIRVANGAPFCLARHEDEPTPVTSLWDLRGFEFYTTSSGYKDTSRWYFHGLLVVETPEARRIYNWSPRHRRFDLVEGADIMIADPREACAPMRDSLRF